MGIWLMVKRLVLAAAQAQFASLLASLANCVLRGWPAYLPALLTLEFPGQPGCLSRKSQPGVHPAVRRHHRRNIRSPPITDRACLAAMWKAAKHARLLPSLKPRQPDAAKCYVSCRYAGQMQSAAAQRFPSSSHRYSMCCVCPEIFTCGCESVRDGSYMGC